MTKSHLQVEVVSHEGRLWHGVASQVQVPAVDGLLGILPGRQPLLAMLAQGQVIVHTSEGQHSFTVDNGVASVDSGFVTIVVDHGSIA
ncbi:hypothetical protein LRP54_00345 [Schaalia sp. lx-100]|nr:MULTISPECIES: hypothetical protein [unclassified Schaalia]MCD4549642.1 hypothetical protein [Schaalia sp. lx-260]MCD4556705.1 hypothetical protein [Schaalia sp. lx-100]